MGKATRWFRSLLPSSNKKPASASNSTWAATQTKSSDNNNERNKPDGPVESLDANKHAIAIAAATAAVAEAALAAAEAAAEVVRLTSAGGTGTRTISSSTYAGAGGCSSRDRRRELAAIKIQSMFRAYLARRALRALKGLVKLQALARGHMVRKQSADMLYRMQAMARIQARACAGRVPSSASKFSRARGGSKSRISDNINTEKLHFGPKWLDHWMEESTRNNHTDTFRNTHDDAKSDKILEIDTWKARCSHGQNDKTFRASQYFSAWKDNWQGATVFDPISGLSAKCQKPNPSISSGEVASLRSLNYPPQEDPLLAWAAEYSPRVHSATSRPGSSNRRAPFTPTRSECSRSLFGDCLAYPNYMANTESYLAKVRSQSAPRQRMQTEKFTGSNHIPRLWDVETSSEKGSTPHANFRGNATLETHVHGGTIGYRMAYEARP